MLLRPRIRAVSRVKLAPAFTLDREYTFETLTTGLTVDDNGNDGFDDAINSGGTTSLFSEAQANAGSKSAAFTIASAALNWGALDHYFIGPAGSGDSTLTNGQEFWTQFWAFHPTGWDDSTDTSTCKFFRYRLYDNTQTPVTGTGTVSFGFVNTGTAITGLRTEREGETPNDVDITLTANGGFALNQWNKFEFYVKIASGTGGIVRAWCNDKEAGEVTGVNTLGSALTTAETLTLMWLDYWNGGAPATQTMYIDQVKIARSTTDSPTNQDASGNYFIG